MHTHIYIYICIKYDYINICGWYRWVILLTYGVFIHLIFTHWSNHHWSFKGTFEWANLHKLGSEPSQTRILSFASFPIKVQIHLMYSMKIWGGWWLVVFFWLAHPWDDDDDDDADSGRRWSLWWRCRYWSKMEIFTEMSQDEDVMVRSDQWKSWALLFGEKGWQTAHWFFFVSSE